MQFIDLGTMDYRDAWARQEQAHAQVLAGGEEHCFFVEHSPVITFGRRGPTQGSVTASSDALRELGIEVVHSDRGGDVTFHGPGQLVVYPIIRLNDHHLSVGAYVQRLEDMVIATLADLGIAVHKDRSAIGIWVNEHGTPAKICALGVRIRKGVSLHGIALNVTTDLSYFDLIVPCGIRDRGITSVQRILCDRAPTMEQVKRAVHRQIVAHFA